MSRQIPARRDGTAVPADAASRLGRGVLDVLGHIPHTEEQQDSQPRARARAIARKAADRAALTAGVMALPPGPAGWLTLLPELLSIWRVQAQMVADIAGVFGHSATLTREHMLYCLFRHAAAQALRDIVVQTGERVLIRRLSSRALQRVAARIGVRISRRVIGRGAARWLPVLGAMAVGAYARYDTRQVAETAIALFDANASLDDKPHDEETPPRDPGANEPRLEPSPQELPQDTLRDV